MDGGRGGSPFTRGTYATTKETQKNKHLFLSTELQLCKRLQNLKTKIQILGM